MPFCSLEACIAVNRLILSQNVEPGLYVELTTANMGICYYLRLHR